MADMTVANTILAQLGGRRFTVMTGARNFLGSADRLQMDVRGQNRINRVVVILDPSDTYTLKAYRIRGLDCREVASESGIYADTLPAFFTRMTGLETRL